jgi:Ca-activated chloride channel family protein
MVMAGESGILDGLRKVQSPDVKHGALSIVSGSAVVAKSDRTGNDELALQESVEFEEPATARGKEAKEGKLITPGEAHRRLEVMRQRIGGGEEERPVDPADEKAKRDDVRRLRNVIRQDNAKRAEDTKEVSSSLSTWSLDSWQQTKNGDGTADQAPESGLKAKVLDKRFKVMNEEGQESAARGSKLTVAPPSDAMAERSVRSDTEKRSYADAAPVVTSPRAPAATATEPPQREVLGDRDGYWVSGGKLEKQHEADAMPADALVKMQREKESRAKSTGGKDLQSDGDVRNREINGRVSTVTNATLFGATMSYIPVPDQEEPRNLPAKFRAFGVNPFVESVSQPFSTFSIDVDTASYTVSRNYMLRGQRPPAEAVRTEEFVNFFDYAYAAPTKETFRVYAEAAPSKFGPGLHMLKIGVKGKRVGREEERRAVLTFLVDTSGSMDKPDRIGLIRKSLKMLLDKLSPKDQVAIVQFDSNVRLALDHTPAAEKEKIAGVLDGLQCSGSTHLEGGMTRAYEVAARSFNPKAENRVLILSDGVANLGTMAAEDILAKVEAYRKQGIYCSVFGFGIGTFDDTMLETLANKGNGTYAFIDSETEAKRVFVDDLAATLNTIAADVKIQVEFNPKRVTKYRQLGYENRQLKKEDFRNDAIDAGEVGSGQSVTALYEVEMKDGREVVATVRLRYRRTDNNRVEEVERAVTAADLKQDFDKADARFRLAACAAEFSEQLRGSPHATGNDFADVASVLRPVALELPLDLQVQELLRMVQSAGTLSLAAQ